MVRQALEQRRDVSMPTPQEFFAMALGALRAPTLAAQVAQMSARVAATRLVYGRYPEREDDLPRWSRARARTGVTPDLAD